MKKTHILALVFVAVLIGVLISMTGDFSQYADFNSSYAKNGKEINVVGTLEKSMPMVYDPLVDANMFTFYLKDDKGEIRKVIYKSEKPTDFEKAEKIVVTGKMKGENFMADKILMKCPSKYKDQAIKAS
jgi:cytochrome c-type biogenesis protein CcmE